MKKLLLALLVLSACNSTGPDNNTTTGTYKPEAIDSKYPIKILYVNSRILVPTTSLPNSPVASGWSIALVNTSDSDFVPYNWRIRSTNGRERTYSIFNNDRAVIPARGMIRMYGAETNFLDTANGFATLVSSDSKEIQTVSWKERKNTVLGFPKPPNTPFILVRVLASPEGTEAENEAISIQNITDTTVSVKDWKIRSTSGKQEQLFQGISYTSFATYELKYKIPAWLNNAADTVQIVNPEGKVVHWIGWRNAKKGQYIYAQP